MISFRTWFDKLSRKLASHSSGRKLVGEATEARKCEERRRELTALHASISKDIEEHILLGDKALVRRLIKRRQQVLQQIAVVDALITTMHDLSFGIESAEAHGEALSQISQLTHLSQQAYKAFNQDSVKKVMDMVGDQHALQTQINKTLTAHANPLPDDDIAALEIDLVNSKLSAMAKIPFGIKHSESASDIELSTTILADRDYA